MAFNDKSGPCFSDDESEQVTETISEECEAADRKRKCMIIGEIYGEKEEVRKHISDALNDIAAKDIWNVPLKELVDMLAKARIETAKLAHARMMQPPPAGPEQENNLGMQGNLPDGAGENSNSQHGSTFNTNKPRIESITPNKKVKRQIFGSGRVPSAHDDSDNELFEDLSRGFSCDNNRDNKKILYDWE
ncbi:unnamed protein product [Rotaria socialis]|uniref:Uncharacterized protein n=1 Tax=Rotaria socialis TaxID=392032 RepID=A0A821VAF0_9BILA|nr:unnamed protein product [Rotaria socialis]CAF4904077.1 unnamed protein product [Rotaria socialis]